MIARVLYSRDLEFNPGDTFGVLEVILEDRKGPSLFEIYAPWVSAREDGILICKRKGCAHLGNGDWEVIYEEGERG